MLKAIFAVAPYHLSVFLQPRWAYDLVESGFYRGISIQHKLWY